MFPVGDTMSGIDPSFMETGFKLGYPIVTQPEVNCEPLHRSDRTHSAADAKRFGWCAGWLRLCDD